MEAALTFHRGNKHLPGPAGDLPWNRLSFYLGHHKKVEPQKKKSFLKKLWKATTLRFDKKSFENNFDEAFCHQNIHRCRVAIWFMLLLIGLHYIFELSLSNPPQNEYYPPSYTLKHPPTWAHILILIFILLYGAYIFQMTRTHRFFFTRAMHALMVSYIFVFGFGLLSLIAINKDISPPLVFIVFCCGNYISPSSKFPYMASVCTLLLLCMTIFLLSQPMLSSHEKISFFLFLCLSNFLGMVVLSLIEVTIRHEFMQIHNTKVEFGDLIKEQAHWETLVNSILPIPVAKALREKNETSVSVRYSEVSIMFAEIVDFETHIALMLSPDETVIFLNRIYMIFDRLIDSHKLEKIKTVGPIIVIAGGLNISADDHLKRLVDLGIDMMLEMDRLSKRIPLKVFLRVGINTGELVAGVIGKTRLCYDVWGDTVNTASRMMTHGIAGKIHMPYNLSSRIYTHCIMNERENER